MLWSSVLVGSSICIFLLIGMEVIFGRAEKKGELSRSLTLISGGDVSEIKKKRKKYVTSKSDFKIILIISIMIFFVVWIFLRSLLYAFIFSLLGILYPRIQEKNYETRKKVVFELQFKDAMQSLSNSLKSGNSLQVSMEKCLEDLNRIYKHKKIKPVVEEWEIIVSDLKLGKSTNDVLIDFRNRVMTEDVDTFVNSAVIINEKGGNLTDVLSNVAQIISDRIEVKRDIQTLTAAKRSEAKVLSLMPIVLVGAIMLLSPGYLEPMYDKPLGKLLAAVGLILLLTNYVIGKKIIDIEV